MQIFCLDFFLFNLEPIPSLLWLQRHCKIIFPGSTCYNAIATHSAVCLISSSVKALPVIFLEPQL